jgi:hypothetical protein
MGIRFVPELFRLSGLLQAAPSLVARRTKEEFGL